MIIVTGTKRSGTSMWMQILRAAGVDVLGEAFPKNWQQTIQPANPHGFWESHFRHGIYYASNPHPETGAYLAPSTSAKWSVKVFIPGLARTDQAFIHRVVGTVRNWREYGSSLERLFALERENLKDKDGNAVAVRVVLPPILEWWLENYMLVRDVAQRQYPVHLVTYDRVLQDPKGVVGPVLQWLDAPNPAAGVAAVKPETRTQHEPDRSVDRSDIEADVREVFDAYYDAVHQGDPLSIDLLERMNSTQDRLMGRLMDALRAVAADVRQRRGAMPKLRPGSPDWLQQLRRHDDEPHRTS